jgi:hypothetical protein
MKKEEYRLVELIDYAGQVKKHTYPKRDLDKAIKAKKDAYDHRGKLLTVYTNEDSAYYRTLNTSYRIEMREVDAWHEVETEVSFE